MSNFLSDILFTMGLGLLLAPTVGMFLFDANSALDGSTRKKRSIIAGSAMFFAPTIIYLASYLFFTVLQG